MAKAFKGFNDKLIQHLEPEDKKYYRREARGLGIHARFGYTLAAH
jgi:hypothetical protein